MFAMLGVAEKAGSGTDKIVKGWREANWRSPKIEEKQKPDKVVLIMPMESLLSEETKVKLTEKFGITANTFDHNVLNILALASDEGYVTNERLRYSLDMHKADISELLKLMVQKKLLISQGYGRGMRYLLPKENLNILGERDATLDGKDATSDRKDATSDEKGATSDKKRMPQKELYALVTKVCQEWRSLDEIVTLTGKSYSYMRNKVIRKMLKEKLLVMLFPGNPNHPNQKYKEKE